MKLLYWMNPVLLMAMWAAIAVITYFTPPDMFQLLMRTPKIYTLDHLHTTLLALFVFAVFAGVGMATVRREPVPPHHLKAKLQTVFAQMIVFRVCVGFFGLVLLAYLIWFGPTLNPSTLRAFIAGEVNTRSVGNQISGVTTMTQFGIALSCVAAYGVLYSPDTTLRRAYLGILVAMVVCALYRSFLWSERLALLETVIPIAIVIVACKNRGQVIFKILPLIGLVAVIAFFGIAEYFRSWAFYSERGIGMTYFATTRFLSYYLSSFNNFGMMLDFLEPSYAPINSLQFFYKLPLPGFEALNQHVGDLWVQYMTALDVHTNPEFNLFSGVGMVVSDFGVVGGLSALSIHGLLSGRLYAMMSMGRIFGLFFYPVWMVGLLEFGRLLYWGNTRVLPAWLLLFILAFVAKAVFIRAYRHRRATAQ